ncbi:MAG TPA: hypothetical protein VGJ55_17230 [Pyrinomonadaceae bacterium]
MNSIKRVFLWSYERTTWQWDVLCVLILIFIFLTPKSWFGTGELHRIERHQSTVAATLLLPPDVIGNEADRGSIERQVRSMTGRSDAVVTAVRRKVDPQGRLAGYEVDIR